MYSKGDRLVCLSDKFHPEISYLYKNLPVKNQVYTCRDCTLGTTNVGAADQNPTFLVLLEELINDIDPHTVMSSCPQELGFRSDRFAPVEEISEEEGDSALVGVGTENKPHWL